MDESDKTVKTFNFSMKTEDPEELFHQIKDCKDKVTRLAYNHTITTAASTGSQFVAMSVFLEGKTGKHLLN